MQRLAPITHLAQELVRFDTQLLQNPAISGVAYQQGTLAGYEVRQYLIEKFDRTCAYCDAQDVPLQIERIVHAFVEPIVRSQMSSAGKSYAQLVAREAADPCSETRGIIAEYFDPFAREFVRAIQLALPGKSPEYVHWAYLFSVGALAMSVFDGRVASISGGTVKPASLAAKTRHMTTFIAAGIRGGPDI